MVFWTINKYLQEYENNVTCMCIYIILLLSGENVRLCRIFKIMLKVDIDCLSVAKSIDHHMHSITLCVI